MGSPAEHQKWEKRSDTFAKLGVVGGIGLLGGLCYEQAVSSGIHSDAQRAISSPVRTVQEQEMIDQEALVIPSEGTVFIDMQKLLQYDQAKSPVDPAQVFGFAQSEQNYLNAMSAEEDRLGGMRKQIDIMRIPVGLRNYADISVTLPISRRNFPNAPVAFSFLTMLSGMIASLNAKCKAFDVKLETMQVNSRPFSGKSRDKSANVS